MKLNKAMKDWMTCVRMARRHHKLKRGVTHQMLPAKVLRTARKGYCLMGY